VWHIHNPRLNRWPEGALAMELEGLEFVAIEFNEYLIGSPTSRGKIASVLHSNSLKLHIFLAPWTLGLAALIVLPPSARAAETSPAVAVPAPAAVPADYRIGPGDTLRVYVFQNDELSVTVPVRPDGKISTPLVEDMVAVGKTPSQLARDIEKSLAEYVKAPKVNVVVMIAVSVFSQVKVIGQVKTPQALPYRDGMTVLDAVLAVGGLGQFAAGNRAHIVRNENGKQTEIKVKLDALVNNGDMKQNLLLKPGDVLVVPETRF
jgi:polysaccharide biosynthesis/export protein